MYGDIKCYLSNASADIPTEQLHQASNMRWSIEQCFQECKSHLGMSHYESRTYQAWHRHMLMVMTAHLFTLELRLHYKKTNNINHAHGQILSCRCHLYTLFACFGCETITL